TLRATPNGALHYSAFLLLRSADEDAVIVRPLGTLGGVVRMRHVVVINGSPRTDSRTGVLLGRLAESVMKRIPATRSVVNMSDSERPVTSYLTRDALPERLERVFLE